MNIASQRAIGCSQNGSVNAGVTLVAAPRVGDEEVETAVLLGRDAGEDRLGLVVVGVVGGDGDAAAAAGGHRVGGVLDGAAAGLAARASERPVT